MAIFNITPVFYLDLAIALVLGAYVVRELIRAYTGRVVSLVLYVLAFAIVCVTIDASINHTTGQHLYITKLVALTEVLMMPILVYLGKYRASHA